MAGLRARFGRPLRLGVVGGGPDSWIGRLHCTAAELDGWWRVVAGVFSGDPARSRESGMTLGFDASRCYGDVRDMIDRERCREDGIDAVAIMSPNDSHYPAAVVALDAGLDIIGDKPVSRTLAEARDLAARTRTNGRLFAVAHGYAAYPMTRYARWLVQDGAIGELRLVQVEYIQSSMAARVEDEPQSGRLRWLLDPARSGLALVMSAIGCHAHHLACFVSGHDVARVAADVGALVSGRTVVDHVSALLEFAGGARGTFTATQAVAGADNDIRLRVCGEKGYVEWSHREASYLRLAQQGLPPRIIGRGDTYLPPEVVAAGRMPRGHPEGMREAFANIYGELAQERMARALGDEPPSFVYPRIDEAVHTMAFIEACLASQERGGWVEVAPA
ncbi:MAG: Gfo/Idh/MocA family oxidoreductase [Acidobacteria bacterium]|nr:Gfo/Idh/MocA family oxidoreductase [Acidobacteriota bacterium]